MRRAERPERWPSVCSVWGTVVVDTGIASRAEEDAEPGHGHDAGGSGHGESRTPPVRTGRCEVRKIWQA
ncbi:hypothetical protein Misp02_20380 [Microtetraspora sp. NBRC 16547]|nr:hypothetical protein Misp02_20380 [Microtetraspora sp. NBRC 16547]